MKGVVGIIFLEETTTLQQRGSLPMVAQDVTHDYAIHANKRAKNVNKPPWLREKFKGMCVESYSNLPQGGDLEDSN